MAVIEGSCTGTSGSKYDLWIDYTITQTEQNKIDNVSQVNVKLYLQRNDGYSASAYSYNETNYRFVKYDNANEQGYDGTFDTRNSALVLLQEYTYTISHNADGTKTISLSGGFETGLSSLSGGSVLGEGIVLPTIPRASTVIATDSNIGSACVVNVNRASTTFTHKIYATFGAINKMLIASNVATLLSFTVPISFYEQIPNAKSGICTITCETYSGTTLIGTTTTTCKMSVDEEDNAPIINYTSVDTNALSIGLTGDNATLVKYISNVRTVITATGQNYATIVSRRIDCADGKYSTASDSTLNGVESGVFTITVTDSRGISNTLQFMLDMVDYVKLTLNPTLYRTSPTNNIIALRLNGNYFNSTFGAVANTLTTKYRYREKGTVTWGGYVTVTPTKNGNTYSLAETSLGSSFDYTKQYEFEVIAYDKIYTGATQKYVAFTVVEGKPVYWWNKLGFYVEKALYLRDILSMYLNGVTSSIYSQNASYLHYSTDATVGHWFNKQVRVQGEVYAGASYDKILAHNEDVVHDTGNETIAGIKTFSSSPIVPTPTTATQVCNKGYADGLTNLVTDGTSKVLKFDNGLCIFIGTLTVSQSFTAWGSTYKTASNSISYPANLFTAILACQVSLENASGWGGVAIKDSTEGSLTTSSSFSMWRGTNPNTTLSITYKVVTYGLWK